MPAFPISHCALGQHSMSAVAKAPAGASLPRLPRRSTPC